MGNWNTISGLTLSALLITSGCQTQVMQPVNFPKPATPTLVIRTYPVPAHPVPATGPITDAVAPAGSAAVAGAAAGKPAAILRYAPPALLGNAAPAATLPSAAPVAPPQPSHQSAPQAAAKPLAAAPVPSAPQQKEELEVAADPDAWVREMRKLHANFTGTPGYVALLGDSITFADAFWTPLEFTDPAQYLAGNDGLPTHPQGKLWKDIIKGTRGKGLDHCNGSGWQVGYILRKIDEVMDREKPEVAIIMIGTNDIGIGQVAPGWQEQYEKIVRKCLDNHCVPILNTIPPRRDRDDAVAATNEIIRNVAGKYRVPLVDYHAELVRRRPGKEIYGTLMQNDGVHPSAGKTNVFTDTNLSDSGYALRNWMNFLAYREVHFRILHPEQAQTVKSASK